MNAVTRPQQGVGSGHTPAVRGAQALVADADQRAARAVYDLAASRDRDAALANACRAVAALFLVGARCGWREADARGWLSGHYGALMRLVRRDRLLLERDTPRAWTDTVDVDADAVSVDHVLVVRHRVLAAIRAIAAGRTEIVLALAHEGSLVRRAPKRGPAYWAPSASADARLADRVLSLLVADFLRRPVDYTAPVTFCETCGGPMFDVEHDATRCTMLARATDVPTSGVRSKDE